MSGYAALYESNPQKNDADSIKQVKLYLNGGTYHRPCDSGTEAVYSEDCTKFVNNGTFSSDVSRYCMDYRVVSKNEDGTYTIVADQYATVENRWRGPVHGKLAQQRFQQGQGRRDHHPAEGRARDERDLQQQQEELHART